MSNRILATRRPYVLTFESSGEMYPLSSEEAQRLIDARQGQIVEVTPDHVVIEKGERCNIMAATLGGGPAFTREDHPGCGYCTHCGYGGEGVEACLHKGQS